MDYGKSGAANLAKTAPRQKDQDATAWKKTPTGRATQAELLTRMKAAAEAKKKG